MLPMVTLDPPLCPVGDHLWAAGNPCAYLGLPDSLAWLRDGHTRWHNWASVRLNWLASSRRLAHVTRPCPSGALIAPDRPSAQRCASVYAGTQGRHSTLEGWTRE